MADEKKKGRLGSLIIMIVVPAAVAFGVTFAVLQLL